MRLVRWALLGVIATLGVTFAFCFPYHASSFRFIRHAPLDGDLRQHLPEPAQARFPSLNRLPSFAELDDDRCLIVPASTNLSSRFVFTSPPRWLPTVHRAKTLIELFALDSALRL